MIRGGDPQAGSYRYVGLFDVTSPTDSDSAAITTVELKQRAHQDSTVQRSQSAGRPAADSSVTHERRKRRGRDGKHIDDVKAAIELVFETIGSRQG